MGFDNVAAQSAPLTDKVSYIRQGYAPQAVKGSVLLLSGVPYVGQEATNKQKEAMLALREYMDTSLPSELDGLAVTDSFKYIEQYVVILSETLRNLTLAVIAVFLACIIMTGSWALSFVTMLGVISADVWLMGLMAALDIALDSISMINLIMAVGLAADYVLHTSNLRMLTIAQYPTASGRTAARHQLRWERPETSKSFLGERFEMMGETANTDDDDRLDNHG
eukprot:Selendium_serpulae@DN4792_c2_g1_i4.p1